MEAEKKDRPSEPVKADKSSKKLPAASSTKIVEDVVEVTEPEVAVETEGKEEPKTLPKIRLKVEEEAGKVKRFATAQGLSMHIKVTKAKRAGLGALHKVATWLTPKKK